MTGISKLARENRRLRRQRPIPPPPTGPPQQRKDKPPPPGLPPGKGKEFGERGQSLPPPFVPNHVKQGLAVRFAQNGEKSPPAQLSPRSKAAAIMLMKIRMMKKPPLPSQPPKHKRPPRLQAQGVPSSPMSAMQHNISNLKLEPLMEGSETPTSPKSNLSPISTVRTISSPKASGFGAPLSPKAARTLEEVAGAQEKEESQNSKQDKSLTDDVDKSSKNVNHVKDEDDDPFDKLLRQAQAQKAVEIPSWDARIVATESSDVEEQKSEDNDAFDELLRQSSSGADTIGQLNSPTNDVDVVTTGAKEAVTQPQTKMKRPGLFLEIEDSDAEPLTTFETAAEEQEKTKTRPRLSLALNEDGNFHDENDCADTDPTRGALTRFGSRRSLTIQVGEDEDSSDDNQSEGFALPLDCGSTSASERSFSTSSNFDPDVISVGNFQVMKSGICSNDSEPNAKEKSDKTSIKDELILLQALGQGAGGIVYKAIHKPTMRCVAVKTIPVYDPVKRAQMLKELKALYSNMAPISGSRADYDGSGFDLQSGGVSATKKNAPCPFIVTFHDAYINAEQCNVNMVVEYMDGGSLQDIIDAGGCSNEDILAQISYRVLQGFRFIHKQHQIHRDIKPANLLINHRGEVKISDFGIVRELDSTQAVASTFVGTLTYMSPERICGGSYSANSDIWSFGLSLMSVALGEYPLPTSGGYWALLSSLNDGPVPSLPSKRFSPDLVDFVDQCLQKDPGLRPDTEQLMMHPFILGAKSVVDAQGLMGENAPPTNEPDQVAELEEILAAYMSNTGEQTPEQSILSTLARQFGVSMDIVSEKLEALTTVS